ncbi:MAG: BON domain-containing protein [Acidobacteriaceae bacterium]|nr:BON domain-containing protein [Acidobacteriaceae bacterium]MBV9781261.1 BON domain-containing protein [Acidobacteriaceae bacterium]
MRRRLLSLACAAVLGFFAGCDRSEKERARQRAEEAREKAHREAERARQEARKLGHEIKQEANDLNRKVERGLQGSEPSGGATAGQKIDNARQEVRTAGRDAAAKLDRAGIIAKVKAALVADLGASTITNIDVDVTDHDVTLRGTVSSDDQKQRAEDAARQVNGVSKVTNLLQVQP